MTAPVFRNYYIDIGRKLTLSDIGKEIVRTMPFAGDRFFMVPVNKNPSNASVILLSIDLKGFLCQSISGDCVRVDGFEAFEAAYLTLSEFLLKVRCEHIVSKKIINLPFEI